MISIANCRFQHFNLISSTHENFAYRLHQFRFALFCAVCNNSIAFGDRPTEIVEVINELPTSTTSKWRVGETEYEIDDSTIIDTDKKPIVGNLAIVAFKTIENTNIATAITPLAISPSSINDGPYLS